MECLVRLPLGGLGDAVYSVRREDSQEGVSVSTKSDFAYGMSRLVGRLDYRRLGSKGNTLLSNSDSESTFVGARTSG